MDFIKTAQVAKLAKELMTEYGLVEQGWTFKLDTQAKTRIGQCRYREKEIGYSLTYLDHTPLSEIEDTIRHEIAHALAGSNHGHDAYWRAMAVKVGAKPNRCGDSTNIAKAKPTFYLKCPDCGHKWYRFRVQRKMIGRLSYCCGAPLEGYRITKRSN